MAGVGKKHRTSPKRRIKIGKLMSSKPSKENKGWVIGRAEAIESSKEENIARAREDLGIEAGEEIDYPAPNNFFAEMDGPLPDDGFYDYSEYDEDNPVTDPDKPFHLTSSWEINDFEARSSQDRVEPKPDIIIDEFGDVEIPREKILTDYYGRYWDGETPLSDRGQQLYEASRMLRAVGERLVKKEGRLLLSGETDFSRVSLDPLTQKDFIGPLGISDKTLRSRIANSYIQTPYWGILHLSFFFQGVKDEWQTIVESVKEDLYKEDPAAPYPTKTLYQDIRKRFSKDLKDDRQFRNILKGAGIPLATRRKEIYKCTKIWMEKNRIGSVRVGDIPLIRKVLISEYNMFSGKQAQQCREAHFIPFVEDRIISVLNELGVGVKS